MDDLDISIGVPGAERSQHNPLSVFYWFNFFESMFGSDFGTGFVSMLE